MNKKLQDCWSLEQELQMEIDWYKKALENIEECLTWDMEESILLSKVSDIVRTYIDGEPTTADEFNEAQIQEGEELMREINER